MIGFLVPAIDKKLIVRHARYRTAWLTRLIVVLALVVLSSGCKITPSPDLSSLEPVKALPRSMGIYFSPEFKTYEFRYEGYKISGDPGDKETFALGAASVDLFKQLFRGMFTDIEEVAERPPPISGTGNLAGVIEPNFEEFTLSSSQEQPRRDPQYRVRLTYRFSLYTPDGKIAVFWISGDGRRVGRRFATRRKVYGEAADDAMNNAAQRLASDFLEIPEIQGWLGTSGRAIR